MDTTEVSTQTSLARFLRNTLGLTGTKIMCGQAGCGACVVTATYIDPATAQLKTRSINSVSNSNSKWLQQFQSFLSWHTMHFLVHYSSSEVRWLGYHHSGGCWQCQRWTQRCSAEAWAVPRNPMWILHPGNGHGHGRVRDICLIFYLTNFNFHFFSSLLANNPNPTLEEIEEVIDGNLCRCTGYR